MTVPSELTQRNQWVIWRSEMTPKGTISKIPHNPSTGGRASSTDSKTWSDHKTAQHNCSKNNKRWDGVGFVFCEGDGLVGIDIDNCIENGVISAEAQAIVDLFGSYTEISPSGRGLHIIVRGSVDRNFRSNGIEVYASKRYFTITGNTLDGYDQIIENQDALDQIVTDLSSNSHHDSQEQYIARRVPTEWIVQRASRAMNGERFKQLWRGTWDFNPEWSQSEADASLMSMLAFWTGPDRDWLCDVFRESGLYREKFEREDYQAGLLALALEGLDDWFEWYPLTAGGSQNGAVNTGAINLEDFVAYMPKHDYIFIPSREHWPTTSVNARFPLVQVGLDDDGEPIMVKPSLWLDQNRSVEQLTWAPGMPLVINNRLMSHAGWIKRDGVKLFNQYRPPSLRAGSGDPAPWLDHVRRVYPDDWEHLVMWMAQRVQNPAIKVNHALVLGGTQGIGKDTILEPLKHCIGAWNFAEVSPANVLGSFNDFAKSVVLRISEARDLGDTDRYKFYEHLKSYIAAPPDALRVNEKFMNEHYVPNVVGVIITTNHMEGGLYLPAEDRRHYVAWSEAQMGDFDESYWTRLWQWYEQGGYATVNGYLKGLSLEGFNPKAPPPKTPAFWDIVASSGAPEDAELGDCLDKLGWPDFVTVSDLISRADYSVVSFFEDRRNSRKIPHRLREVGYVRVRNPDTSNGLWKVHGKRQVVYGRADLSQVERLAIVRKAIGGY